MKYLARGVPAKGFLRGLYSSISILRVYIPIFPVTLRGDPAILRGGCT